MFQDFIPVANNYLSPTLFLPPLILFFYNSVNLKQNPVSNAQKVRIRWLKFTNIYIWIVIDPIYSILSGRA